MHTMTFSLKHHIFPATHVFESLLLCHCCCVVLQGCRFLQQLVQDMNAQLTTFTSLEHYEAELGGSITPMIADKFEALDDDSADLLQVGIL